MTKKKQKVDFILIFMSLVALLAIFLGGLQFHWINNSTRSTEFRLITNLNNTAAQVINSVRLETGLLYSILYLNDRETDTGDYSRFSEDMETWRDGTSYPDMLKNIFLILPIMSTEGDPEIQQWNDKELDFESIPVPEDFKRVFPNDREERWLTNRDLEKMMQNEGFFLISSSRIDERQNEDKGELRKPPPVLVIEIDTETLYRVILPAYMEIYLPDYPFRITGNDPEEILYEYGEILPGRVAETSIPLNRALFMPYEDQFANTTKELSIDFLLRLRMNITENHDGRGENGKPEYHLHIYYPGEDLSSQIKQNRQMNLIVSFGFLALFIIALVILYILYRRTRALRIKERNFISSMSHELRTPIAVIRSTSHTLGKGIVKDPERVKLYGNTIETQADRLGESVDGILKYSGLIENSTNNYAYKKHNLSEMTAEVARIMKILIIEKGGKFIYEIQADIKLKINPEAYRLIVENLLSNAVKHGLPAGEGVVVPGEIRLGLKTEGGFAILSVSDKGPGISLNEKKRIFKAFYRGENSRENQTPGNGLGLHLIKQTIEMVGGSIEVRSPCLPGEPGSRKGTEFTVQLPLIPEIST